MNEEQKLNMQVIKFVCEVSTQEHTNFIGKYNIEYLGC